ncbi:hypothetical protein ADUPG1_008911 [Aduncisulcus paluster]|uniref:Uncharacterized protein n=1 Tax=Aduncisulcus paluster TaxID=2918883 RepID=A0ABQ5KTN4_9EUKA|nr:hypothetical protein ADUPG1_008911 [Aduncisulcus paluster]
MSHLKFESVEISSAVFVNEGDISCIPIPRDDPTVLNNLSFSDISATDETEDRSGKDIDKSSSAQEMMKGERNYEYFTSVSIPFSQSNSMKGAYICLNKDSAPPSYLVFTFSSSKGEKISKRFNFRYRKCSNWFFLPIDLSDVVLCEIKGMGRIKSCFNIHSLVFIREETPEESALRESKELIFEKMWHEALSVESKLVKIGGIKSRPTLSDDSIVMTSSSLVTARDESERKESEGYDQSAKAQKMLKGEMKFGDGIAFSYISIPFLSPSPLKGAYICVNAYFSSPSLLFEFTQSDGKKTSIKYKFAMPEDNYQWEYLSIDLSDVVLCEIKGKGQWDQRNSRVFSIYSLVFTSK